MNVLKENSSLLIVFICFIIACQGIVLKNDDLRFICKTYTESNHMVNETIIRLFDRLIARDVPREEVIRNANLIQRLVMAMTNQFGDKDYLKQTANDVVTSSLSELSSHMPSVSVVTGPPAVVFEAEGIPSSTLESIPADLLLLSSVGPTLEGSGDLIDQEAVMSSLESPWRMLLEHLSRSFYRFLDQMKSMCRQLDFPFFLDLEKPQQIRKFLLDLIIQRQKMFVQYLENERSKEFSK